MKYAAAGGVVALAVLFGAIMAIRTGDDSATQDVSTETQTETQTEADPDVETDIGSDDDPDADDEPVSSPSTTSTPEPDEDTTSTTEPDEDTTTSEISESDVTRESFQSVAFNVGETSTVMDGTVGPNERVVFTIEAAVGQTLDLDLTLTSGDATYQLFAPDDSLLVDEAVLSSTLLPADGTYQVIVTVPDPDAGDSAEFMLSISIPAPQLRLADFVDPTGPEEIKFAAGGFSTTISSGVVRAEAEIYTFDTNDDVTAFVTIASLEDNAVFQIYDPDGEQLAFESVDSTWAIDQAGVYTIIVTGTRGNATFDLTLELS